MKRRTVLLLRTRKPPASGSGAILIRLITAGATLGPGPQQVPTDDVISGYVIVL